MVSAIVIRGGSSLFLIITPHRLRRVQQLRRHIRRNPRRHAPIRRNIRPTALQTPTGLHDGLTATVSVFDGASLSQPPPTHQTAKTMKRQIIAFHLLLSAKRKTSIMTPDPARPILPVLRHIGYLPLVVSNTPRRMFSKVHQDALRMRRNPLTVHGNRAAHVD